MDRLLESECAQLDGKRIAVLTNHTAIDGNGVHLIEHLLKSPNTQIVSILAPEHGFFGKLDQEHIPDSQHAGSGLKIFSLYGETRKPTPQMLEGVDLLLFDIQDIGVRFYTYATTLLYAMEVCDTLGLEVLVLDRPNPLGGVRVTGPMLDTDKYSMTGSFPMPVVHGMTMGEMALMFRGERFTKLKLRVIECRKWNRTLSFEKTGLLWINPSPNMRNLRQAQLYAAIGLLEFTNVSVGRGTDTPFEVFGAPWIEPCNFVTALKQKSIQGVAFVPTFFTPTSGPYAHERCGGMQILLEDPETLDPIDFSYKLYRLLKERYPENYKSERYIRLLANQQALDLLNRPSEPLVKVRSSEQSDLESFMKTRGKYLIYE